MKHRFSVFNHSRSRELRFLQNDARCGLRGSRKIRTSATRRAYGIEIQILRISTQHHLEKHGKASKNTEILHVQRQ